MSKKKESRRMIYNVKTKAGAIYSEKEAQKLLENEKEWSKFPILKEAKK